MRGEQGDGTYSRGFFLGPGLPLGFGMPSMSAFPLLDPGFGPGMPFLLTPLVGGAKVFESETVPFSNGVEVASVVLLEGAGGSTACVVGVEVDDEDASDGDSF